MNEQPGTPEQFGSRLAEETILGHLEKSQDRLIATEFELY